MAVGKRGFVVLRLFIDVNAKQDADQPHGEQNAANTKRIGHGVAHPHLVDDAGFDAQIAQDLLPRAERRRVGDRPGENAQHHGQRDSKDFMQNGGDQPAHHHNAESKQVEPQSGDTKRGEKTRSHLNPDGINEQDQAELLGKVEHFGAQHQPELVGKVADKNAAKQHPAYPKPDAADFDIPYPQANNSDQGQHADG